MSEQGALFPPDTSYLQVINSGGQMSQEMEQILNHTNGTRVCFVQKQSGKHQKRNSLLALLSHPLHINQSCQATVVFLDHI